MNTLKIPKLTILDNDSANALINNIYNHFKTILNQYSITFSLFNELANIFIHHQNEYVKTITAAYELFKQTHSKDLLKTSPFIDEIDISNDIYEKFTLSQDSHKYINQYDKLCFKLMDDTFDRVIRECKLVSKPHKAKYTYNELIRNTNWELDELYDNIVDIFYCFTNLDI